MEPVSREDDPSPFAWIFGGLVAVVGLGAAAAGLWRRRGSEGTEDPLVADPGSRPREDRHEQL
ncbi:MAG: hypothetical protein ABIP45_02645 [Knoellia sp.]